MYMKVIYEFLVAEGARKSSETRRKRHRTTYFYIEQLPPLIENPSTIIGMFEELRATSSRHDILDVL